MSKTKIAKRCAACGEPLPEGSHGGRKYCEEICDRRRRPAPAVYRYVCPDGRNYVGAIGDIRKRNDRGLSRSNPWVDEALMTYPASDWSFEILKTLPAGCSKKILHRTEQKYIERLQSFDPKYGFNIRPATWFGDTPGILAARARRAEQLRQDHQRWEERRTRVPEGAASKRAAARLRRLGNE